MPLPTIFCVALPPEYLLETVAPTIVEAITAAQAALSHMRPVDEERAQAQTRDGDVWYTMTCLLCGATNPQRAGQSALVALQEHQMEQHGLTPRDFQQAMRVFSGELWAGQYVWVLPRPGQTALACTRASRYDTAARRIPLEEQRVFSPDDLPQQVRTQPSIISLVAREPSAPGSQQPVELLGEDDQAWYGFATGGEWEKCWLIWPKSAWHTA